jgi:hypothetical protein
VDTAKGETQERRALTIDAVDISLAVSVILFGSRWLWRSATCSTIGSSSGRGS